VGTEFTSTLQLSYFIAVAEEQHFGRAATRLGVSQSTISQQVRALEAHLGVVLLDRSTRYVRLSPAGEKLLEPARIAVERAREFDDQVRQIAAGMPVRVGVAPYAVGVFTRFRPALNAVTHAPRCSVEALPGQKGLQQLLAGNIDALFVASLDGPQMRQLRFVEVIDDFGVAIVSADHRLARQSTVTLAELASHRLLVGSAFQSVSANGSADITGRAGVRPRFEVADGFEQHLADAANAGDVVLGSRRLFEWMTVHGLKCLDIVDPVVPVHVGFAVSPGLDGTVLRQVHHLAQALREILA